MTTARRNFTLTKRVKEMLAFLMQHHGENGSQVIASLIQAEYYRIKSTNPSEP